jgi:hypothetical protein
MAIIGPAWLKKSGRSDRWGQDGVREYTAVYGVLTNSPEECGERVQGANGIPLWGDTFVTGAMFDTGAYLAAKQDRQVESVVRDGQNYYVYDVVCTFSSRAVAPGVDPRMRDPRDPCERPTQWSGSSAEWVDHPGQDLDHKSFLNSAGDRYRGEDAGIPMATEVFYATKITRTHPLSALSTNTVNLDAFYLCAPGTVLLKARRWREIFENGEWLYEVSYEFHYRYFREAPEKSWYRRLVDCGPHYYADMDDDGTPDVDDPDAYIGHHQGDGTPTTLDFNLDGEGGKLPDGEELHYNYFRVFEWATFADLELE